MFQTRLKELREAAGYKSQQSFADVFGVAQSTVGGWEAGKREPNYATTMRLAKFFGVSVDDLLDHKDPKGNLIVQESEPSHNVVKVAGRDGSMFECTVSDGQMEFIKQMLVNLKPVDDENV